MLPKQEGSSSLVLLRKSKTCIIAKFDGTDFVLGGRSRQEKTPSYSPINMVLILVLDINYFVVRYCFYQGK